MSSSVHTQTLLGALYAGDCLEVLKTLPDDSAQSVIVDPPYFRVLQGAAWDNAWADQEEWLDWAMLWLEQCHRVLRPDGLMFIFGQLGKREHVWLHFCSRASFVGQFHDMLIWDRAVGYNERSDSFNPQYEMALVLRKSVDAEVFFDKDAVRIPYDEKTIQAYLKDKRYRDSAAREEYLRKGKRGTNILRIPSLKGSHREKVGHPSQKPEALIEALVRSSTRSGDLVLDPFLGSGTTAVVAERTGRRWLGVELDPSYLEMAAERLLGAPGGSRSAGLSSL